MTNLASDGFDGFLQRARAVERAGLYGIGVGDTPQFRDPYVSLAAAATVTSRVRLGPVVTNAVTRHPAATASAISSLDDLSGGRAFLGFGAGDSAAHQRGARPSRIGELREGVTAIRDLLHGRGTQWAGQPVGPQWSRGPVPLVLAANGPLSLRLAGELADGVLMGGGIDPDNVASAVGRVRDGEAAAGRTPGSVDIWIVARTSIAGSLEEGYERVRIVLSVAANHALRADLKAGRLPDDLIEPARTYCDGYSFDHHGTGPANPNVDLLESLGLRDYLVERLAVVGNGEHVAAAYTRLARLGVTGVLVPAVSEDADELIRRLGEEVLPRVDGLGPGTSAAAGVDVLAPAAFGDL
ncbi:5,10-methylenetetrahydromethanopterin reductase [Arthrobacter ginsengisoli]|uniref:5,10-methylenetetrahydromethanopterin reductase n=1 Tax=Arthrobacter ginsengisoli TaxID=1356565 RepID=A0ABU1UG39_9MICC|nr:LLM class flavin-dependent oxidoreductase [Arthrobacter ginsengisoli]MDR7084156.1 5,10-methylenetetrahydromethanopterin reductase [Arthrobacter ginsengisoli]